MTPVSACPLCGQEDAVRCREDARFYVDGQLTAVCFHGHEGRGPAHFLAETGELLRTVPLEPYELLYRSAEADGARGFGAAFLAEHCGIYVLTRESLQRSGVAFPSERDWLRAEAQDGALTVAPLYRGARMVGLQARIVERRDIGKVTKWTRVVGGQDGVYIANPRVQPVAVVVLEGVWDVVAAAWDALQAGEPHRYAWMAIAAGTNLDLIRETLQAHFPGVPVLVVTDQDAAGKGPRAKLARLGTLAILPGQGLAKDYREANPKTRWEALLAGIERAMAAPEPAGEHGLAKIARRAVQGAMRGKALGLRDLEAWRFGQRCAGICCCRSGSKRYFSMRARLDGGSPQAEGQHDYEAILNHPAMRDLRGDYPDLAAVLDGGPTESPAAQSWLPPQFVEDGRHWTQIPERDRKAYAREHGWEPWIGKDPGPPQSSDVGVFRAQLRDAYQHIRIPEVPDSEVSDRLYCLMAAMALSGLWAEERWGAHLPVGFLPCEWFYGGDTTGKGTAAKTISCLLSGGLRTYGSQRFDGATSGWLTESVLYLPICFRDELDEFMNHSDVEDLKTNLAGDPLQVRKKFEATITLMPKPVVFSTNSLKINEDDEATKSRILVVNLKARPESTRADRSGAFDGYYRWLEGGGQDLVYRVGISLYQQFRQIPLRQACWTRSGVFDTALDFVAGSIGYRPEVIMAAVAAAQEQCIREGLPWFQSLLDFVHHELQDVQGESMVRLASALGIDPSIEAQGRKLRRWFGQIEAAMASGPLQVGGWEVRLGPPATTTSRLVKFVSQGIQDENGHSGHPDTTRIHTREDEIYQDQWIH